MRGNHAEDRLDFLVGFLDGGQILRRGKGAAPSRVTAATAAIAQVFSMIFPVFLSLIEGKRVPASRAFTRRDGNRPVLGPGGVSDGFAGGCGPPSVGDRTCNVVGDAPDARSRQADVLERRIRKLMQHPGIPARVARGA